MSIHVGVRLSKGQKWPGLLRKLGLFANGCNSDFYTTAACAKALARRL